MDRNRNQSGLKRLNSQSRAHHRKMSDDDLDTLAQAFGSHLIRNSPPREGSIIPSRVNWKLNNR